MFKQNLTNLLIGKIIKFKFEHNLL